MGGNALEAEAKSLICSTRTMQKKMGVGFKQETEITSGKKGRKEGTRVVSKKKGGKLH